MFLIIQVNLYAKTETASQTEKTNLWSPKETVKRGERQIRSMGLTDTNHYTL